MSGNPNYYYNDPSLYTGQAYPSYAMQTSNPSTQYYYNDPTLYSAYSAQNYPSYTLPATSPPPTPVLSQDAIRKVVLQHPKAQKKDNTQAWIIGGLTALGVGAIAIWQRKALSQVWENVFKHEKSPSVNIPKPPSSTKQFEETIEEQIPDVTKQKPRDSGSSGSSAGSPKSNPEPPPKASEPPPKASEPPPKASEPPPKASEPPPKASEPPPKASEPPPKASEPPPPKSESEPKPQPNHTPEPDSTQSATKAASDVKLSEAEKKLVAAYNIDKNAFCNNVDNFRNLTAESVRCVISEIVIKFKQEKRGNYYVDDTGTLLFPSNRFRFNEMNRPSFFDCFSEIDTKSYWEDGREINPAIKSEKTEFELIEPARIQEGTLIKKGIIKWVPSKEPSAPIRGEATRTATASSLPDDVEALVKTFKMDARETFEADNPGVQISLNASNMPEHSSYGMFHIIKKTGLVFPSSKFRTSSGKEYLEPFFEIVNPKNVDTFGTLKVKKPAKVDSDYKVIEKGIIEICR